jgi:hypothetical protein
MVRLGRKNFPQFSLFPSFLVIVGGCWFRFIILEYHPHSPQLLADPANLFKTVIKDFLQWRCDFAKQHLGEKKKNRIECKEGREREFVGGESFLRAMKSSIYFNDEKRLFATSERNKVFPSLTFIRFYPTPTFSFLFQHKIASSSSFKTRSLTPSQCEAFQSDLFMKIISSITFTWWWQPFPCYYFSSFH